MPELPAASPVAAQLPKQPFERLTRPLALFLRVESAGGVVLLACAAAALALANSPLAPQFSALWHTHVALDVGPFRLAGDLGHFVINDVLMTVFFFLVGLEIKREMVTGELRDPRKAALPVFAAAGGMIVPAAVYMALQWDRPGFRGWGIPMATDIAFVVGVMALLGRRVPIGLKIFLLSLAIVDDIGAVLVIAAFYSGGIDVRMLGLAAGGLGVVVALRVLGVRAIPVYVVAGAGVWLACLKSGVHPTVAGVTLGLMTPSATWVRRESLRLALADLLAELRGDREDAVGAHDLQLLAFAARESVSPLDRLEHALHPWVSFGIMPLFALANAGVVLRPAAVSDPIALAVAAGLVVGKPVGVVLFAWLAVRLGFGRLPSGVDWGVLLGGGFLAGIGFTMSLFVAGLALEGDALAAGKIGTLLGSVCSAAVGTAVLLLALRRRAGSPLPSGERGQG